MPTLLKDAIKNSRNIKDASLNTYLSSVKRICQQFRNTIESDLTTDNIECLKDFDKISKYIKSLAKLTTQKNKLTSIIVALSIDKDSNKELIDKYSDLLNELTDKYTAFIKQQIKTPTQTKNWLTYEQVIDILTRLKNEIKAKRISKEDTLTSENFDILQQYVILSTYINYPLRNDYADMKVVSDEEYEKIPESIKDDNNYLVVFPGKKEFHINQFKTKKSLGKRIIPINKNLNKIIDIWLKYNDSGYYIVSPKKRGNAINPNQLTKYLNKIFHKYTKGEKRISSSMLRHIIISHNLQGTPTIKEKEAEAKEVESKYLHSKEMNELYRKL